METKTTIPPATYRGEANPIWVLVPNLLYIRETDKAVLFTHQLEDREMWLPKSELHMAFPPFSTYFTCMSKWICGKHNLMWHCSYVGQEISLEWLERTERLYEKDLLGEAKDLVEWSKRVRKENERLFPPAPLTARDILRDDKDNPSLARARARMDWTRQNKDEIERQLPLPLVPRKATAAHFPLRRGRVIREDE
jgi:hypothetical protein